MNTSLRAALRIQTLLFIAGLCAATVSAQPAQPKPITVTPSPSPIDADTEQRCFQAAVSLSDETAWCDVLITAINARLPAAAADTAALARSYHNRALLLLNSGELALAEADLLAAISLKPGQAELRLAMGNLRLQQRRFNEALELYNDAIELSAASPPGYFMNRALALRGLGQIPLAAEDVARAEALRRPEVPPGNDAIANPNDTDAAPGGGFQ